MNKQDFKGGTPLHVASSEGQQKILNYFLEIRASGLDALDGARLTPSNFGTKWRISEGTHTSLGSRRKKRKSLLDVIAYRYIYCNGGAIDWVGSRYTRNYDGKKWRDVFGATDEGVLFIVKVETNSPSVVPESLIQAPNFDPELDLLKVYENGAAVECI